MRALDRVGRAPFRWVAALVVIVTVVALTGALHAAADPAGPASSSRPPPTSTSYQPPAPVEVLRAFEAPSAAFGPGHRGVDLAVEPGDPVRAAAPGEVRHAGPVAGVVWVSVAHSDGVVTSYGPLTELTVTARDRVDGGQEIGRLAAGGHGDGGADRGLHWGARRGHSYFDPLSLLDQSAERPSLLGPGGWEGAARAVESYEPWAGMSLAGVGVASSPVADRSGFAVPPGPGHLVLVHGLGSSSADGLRLDPAHLGYDPASVTALSYAGRRTDATAGDPDDPWRDQLPYQPSDTWAGVEAASLRLRDQLRAQAAREPGRPVDLLGHSMGGLVALHYLTHHHDPYDPSLPSIGHVVTVAAPHSGSDLAALAAGLRGHRVGDVAELALRGADRVGVATAERLSLTAPAIDQLSPGSAVLGAVTTAWAAALEADAAGPLATGTRVLTIGGANDLVVGASRSGVVDDGSTTGLDATRVEHRVLPGSHAGVLATEALRDVVWRFLAGEDVVASPGIAATWMSHARGGALRLLGGLLCAEDVGAGSWSPVDAPRRSRLP